ncbi:uncharacterized protein LOC34618548 [Cyclospora cayetanensis]|uniref:Uncharacterized protein LOC34618548 n=1 Tax=Cyclospora cayetanensis TaxID=88456 RepID=A0A6P6S2L5_9EIME|nr:uncharacterized protein LOC34618548 [Cyclospora cayetanensis]
MSSYIAATAARKAAFTKHVDRLVCTCNCPLVKIPTLTHAAVDRAGFSGTHTKGKEKHSSGCENVLGAAVVLAYTFGFLPSKAAPRHSASGGSSHLNPIISVLCRRYRCGCCSRYPCRLPCHKASSFLTAPTAAVTTQTKRHCLLHQTRWCLFCSSSACYPHVLFSPSASEGTDTPFRQSSPHKPLGSWKPHWQQLRPLAFFRTQAATVTVHAQQKVCRVSLSGPECLHFHASLDRVTSACRSQKMGCTQSSAASPQGASVATAGHRNGPPGTGGGTQGDPLPEVVLQSVATAQPAGKMRPNEACALGGSAAPQLSTAEVDAPIVVGTVCTPPPAGREGGIMKVGTPPDNLQEIPGEPCGSGRVKRDEVKLSGGMTYAGTWKGSAIDGHGTLKASDGSTYTGQFVNGKLEGQGIWESPAGERYEGHWKDGKGDGKGKLTNEDGSSYVGEFKMDIKNGRGVETWSDGTVFEGEFKNGDKVGRGKIRFPDGSTYEGSFKADLIDGKGVYVWANKCKYDGAWKEGLMNGSGVYTWPGGQYSKYEGGFQDGLREGKGKLHVRDGRRYSGEFHRNKMHGQLFEIMPSGKKRVGKPISARHLEKGPQHEASLPA